MASEMAASQWVKAAAATSGGVVRDQWLGICEAQRRRRLTYLELLLALVGDAAQIAHPSDIVERLELGG